MEQDQDEVVTSMPDLSRVRLADLPAPTRRVIERLTRGGEQVSAFNSSI